MVMSHLVFRRHSLKPFIFFTAVSIIFVALLASKSVVIDFNTLDSSRVSPGTAKVLLFFLMMIAGMGMFLLVAIKHNLRHKIKRRNIQLDIVRLYGITKDELKLHPTIPAYAAGVLYIWNPLTYSNWRAGNFMLLAGYAIVPYVLKALFSYINVPSWKKAFILTLLYSLLAFVSLHVFLLSLFVGVLAYVAYTISAPQKLSFINELLQSGAFSFLLFAVINSYWLRPLVSGTSSEQFDLTKILHESAPMGAAFSRSVIVQLLFIVCSALLSLYVFWGVGLRSEQDKPQTYTLLLAALLAGLLTAKPDSIIAMAAVCYFAAYGLQSQLKVRIITRKKL